ncbi:GNAT family N-acetyltransferase [Scopulibacillus darangshiensis]|nr:GNAT family protein [Scopulibacillus darangshiensis]
METDIRLIGKKVILRPIREADYRTLWNFTYGEQNPEWKKWDAPYFPLEWISYDAYVEKKKMQAALCKTSQMAIVADNNVIGMVSYYWEHKASNWLEAGIVIYDTRYWNGGYGTEAMTLWVGHLFTTMPLVRVGITTWSGNKRMMRTAEKIGMQLEGRLRKCRYYNGKYYDSIRMGMLREEWDNLQENNH